VSRSKQLNQDMPADYDPKSPPLVTPGLDEPPPAASAGPTRRAEKAVVVNLRH